MYAHQTSNLTPAEAATYLEISIATLYKLVKAGKIKPYKHSPRKVRYPKESLDLYLTKLNTAQEA